MKKDGNTSKKMIKRKVKYFVLPAYAHIWKFIYNLQSRFSRLKVKFAFCFWVIFFLSVIIVSFYFSQELQKHMESYFAIDSRLQNFKTMLITISGALIGAGAISFSLIMFTMQVNVERLPYGLFWRFSSDKKIIIVFISILILAVSISSVSLYVDSATVAISVLSAFWILFFIILLIIYAYRRSLTLINPVNQLKQILYGIKKEMQIWDKWARRIKPLLEKNNNDTGEKNYIQTSHDISRVTLFQLHPHWSDGTNRAVNHVISYAHRYSEYGDYMVSDNALYVLVEINALYIKTKGKTFFTDSFLLKNPLSNDSLINNTLEQLRQTLGIAFSRKDERQVEQTLHAFAKLVILYCDIDYSSIQEPKQHANLAAAYLSDGVQAATRNDLTDVVMQGVRWMGKCASTILVKSNPNEIITLIDNIGIASAVGIVSEKKRPITLVGIEQFAILTINLFLSKNHDISFAAKELRNNVVRVAKLLLHLPNTSLIGFHSHTMAPYYAEASTDTLIVRFKYLVNELINTSTADKETQKIFNNIEAWADGLYQTEKELFLLAIEKRSQFTFDMIHWISEVSKLLLVLSKVNTCPDYERQKLEEHALWLFSTLSWIKDDEKTVAFVENYRMTEILFEIAFEAQQRNCVKFSEKAKKLLIDWAFKAGKYSTTCSSLEKAIYGLIVLALAGQPDIEIKWLKNNIIHNVSVEQNIKTQVADKIRKRSVDLFRKRYGFSRIETVMAEQDPNILRPILKDIANILSPSIEEEE